jgi:hypothetical protein
MVSWSLVLPMLKFALPLPRLVSMMSSRRRNARDPAREARVAELVRLLYRARALTGSDNCLERSLIAYRYLGAAGADPIVVVGMRPGESVEGHVWLTVDGAPVVDAAGALEAFVPVVRFDASGKRLGPA